MAWYNSGWLYRKGITIDYTKVTTDLTNFPVLITRASDTDLAADAQDDGDDILFTSSDGTTKLDHEIEKFDGATGELVAWVRVLNLSSTSNTVLYMYYGNATAANQGNVTGVWNTNFKGVWHLKDLTTSTVDDSTANGNDGTKDAVNQPIEIDGKIAKGQDYDATDDRINAGSGASIDDLFAAGGTVSAWIYPTGWGGGGWGRIYSKSAGSNDASGHALMVSSTLTGLQFNRAHSSATGKWKSPAGSISLSAWFHVAVTYTEGSANDPTIYINGASVSVTEVVAPSGTPSTDAAQNMQLGDATGTTRRVFDGIIDEIRVSNVIRSAGWIATEYNNQNSPNTFYSVGAEEAVTVAWIPKVIMIN